MSNKTQDRAFAERKEKKNAKDTGCLAGRLTNWIVNNKILSTAQKGFMPFDGVFEHRYIVKHLQNKTRKDIGELCLAQIDFSNAFGSISHSAIHQALINAGAGGTFAAIIKGYQDTSTEFITGEGISPKIKIQAGVRQGCPISGLLFNIVIEPILITLQNKREGHHVLAFADDVSLIEENPTNLQNKLNELHLLAGKLNIEINTAKCSTYHLSGATPVGTRNTSFYINCEKLNALGSSEISFWKSK